MTDRPVHRSTMASRIRLARKELREILRDRRTILTLVLMPILVYPLIGTTFQKFLATQLLQPPEMEYRIGLRDQQTYAMVQRWLRTVPESASDDPADAAKAVEPQTKPDKEAGRRARLYVPQSAGETYDLQDLLRQGTIDVGLSAEVDASGITRIQLATLEGSSIGSAARSDLESRFRTVNESFLRSELQRLSPETRVPVEVSRTTVAGTGEAPFSLATLVPLILILMTVTGAVYPAIDLTAGERERGTLEALISAPISRREILFAKYVAVLTVALLTAVANLAAMTATAYITGLESLLFGRGGVSLWLMIRVLGVLAVFAGFFSAILLAVTSFARSFKEAQAYLIPIMLVSIAPGIMALMPELQLSYGLACAPLANIVLLTRDLFEGQLETGPALVALASTLVYTVIGLTVAARVFGTDAVLYGSSGNWSEVWQRPARGSPQPSAMQVLACLAGILPAFLLGGRLLGRWVETSLDAWLAGQLALTVSLFVGWPLACALWQRLDGRSAFQLRSASWLSFLAAALAGVSLWPFAYESLVFLLPGDQLQALAEKFAGLEARLRAVPFGLRLFVFAVAPAVTEELFFRGYLLQGLSRDWGRWRAIFASAAIFGAFHVFVQGLSFERFLPTTLLGIFLGWTCCRTGSVWPGMLLHVLNNGFLIALTEWSEDLQTLGIGQERQSHLPVGWLLTAGVLAVIAWGLLIRSAPTGVAERLTPRAV